MSDLVHYMLRDPVEGNGLIYPTELADDEYVGVGGFFLLGTSGAQPADFYRFLAVRGEQTLVVGLARYRDSRSFFQAAVPGVGSFLFLAQPIPRRPSYAGTTSRSVGLQAIRRLRSWRPQELDMACTNHDFYFTGYSPRFDDSVG
jgi:hypothetical protein